MKLIKYILLITFIFLAKISYAVEVYYAGFSYLGESQQIEASFPYSHKLNAFVEGAPAFDRELRTKLANGSYKFDMHTAKLADLNNEDAVSFTFALQNETTSVEKIGDLYKVLIQLEGQLLFFDFNTMSVVSSFPIYVQYNDVSEEQPTAEYITQQYQRVYFERIDVNIFDLAIKRLQEITLKQRYNNYIQVVNSSLSDKAFSHSPEQSSNERKRLAQYYAQSFSQFMSANQHISVLPYIKGHAIGNKLAGRYANGEVYTLQLPEPDYAVDIEVLAFKRKLFSKESGGSSYIYAAQADFNFYQPLSGRSYFNSKLFNGATKVIPASQTSVDHWAAYSESLMLLFDKFTVQMSNPTEKWLKKHAGNKKHFKSFVKLKEVIDRCR